MIKYISFFVFLINGVVSYCQDSNVFIKRLTIKDEFFLGILDSVISMDKHCSYYTDSLYYSIRLTSFENNKDKMHYLLILEANDNIKCIVNQFSYPEINSYIKHKNHHFFIKGNLPSFLKKEIDEEVNYIVDKQVYNEDAENDFDFDSIDNKNFQITESNSDVVEDDSWAIRCFIIFDGGYWFSESINLYRCLK